MDQKDLLDRAQRLQYVADNVLTAFHRYLRDPTHTVAMDLGMEMQRLAHMIADPEQRIPTDIESPF